MTPAEVTAWLSRIGKTRKWLADEIETAYGTLSNQFSSGKFTKPVLAKILRVKGGERRIDLTTFTGAQIELIDAAMEIRGYKPRDEDDSRREQFLVTLILTACREIVQADLERRQRTLRAAEDAPNYSMKRPAENREES